MSCPDALIIPDIRIVSAANQLILVVVFDLRKGVIVFTNPKIGVRVLGYLALFRRGLDLPTQSAINRLFAEQLVIELIRVALFEILETEIGTEKPGRTILQRDAPLAIDRRCPH